MSFAAFARRRHDRCLWISRNVGTFRWQLCNDVTPVAAPPGRGRAGFCPRRLAVECQPPRPQLRSFAEKDLIAAGVGRGSIFGGDYNVMSRHLDAKAGTAFRFGGASAGVLAMDRQI